MSEVGLLGRVTAKVAGALPGLTSGWMPPGEPPAIGVPAGTPPRTWDFPVGVNLRRPPRMGERFSALQLRALAENCTLVQLAIQTRIAQVARLKWHIQPRDPDVELDAKGAAIDAFLRKPDGRRRWGKWVKPLLFDVLVLDDGYVRVARTRGGDPLALQVFDAATIVPKVDESGDVPLDLDAIAYQQIIKGAVLADFTRRDLIHAQFNPRTYKLYGFSPVEQIATIVNLCIRREYSQLEYFTEGTVPEAIVTMPKDWSGEAIREFQTWWDGLFLQNQAQQRKMRFVPGGDGMNIHWAKDALLKDETDEWLARVVCYAFSLPPTWAVRAMNRATSEQMQDAALEEGQLPFMADLADVFNDLLEYGFGRPDLEHVWEEPRKSDPLKQAEVLSRLTGAAIITVDEARGEIGRKPIGVDVPMVLTPAGPMPLTALVGDGATDDGADDGTPLRLPDGTTGTAPVADPSSAALAGPQIAALLDIVAQVRDEKLSPEAAVAVIRVAFPTIDEAEARRIVDGAQATPPQPTPVPPPPGLPSPETPPGGDGSDDGETDDETDGETDDTDAEGDDPEDGTDATKVAGAGEGGAERGDPQLRKRRPAPASPPSPSAMLPPSVRRSAGSRAPWGAY